MTILVEMVPGFFERFEEYIHHVLTETSFPEAWLFPRLDSGELWDHVHTGKTMITMICKFAGIPRRRPYSLRHTFASVLMMDGYPPSQIAAYMGDRVRTVLDNYIHYVSDVATLQDYLSTEEILALRDEGKLNHLNLDPVLDLGKRESQISPVNQAVTASKSAKLTHPTVW